MMGTPVPVDWCIVRELGAEIIRAARQAAGWSIVDAARELRRHSNRSGQPVAELDSIVRSWKRWERGTEPSRFYRPLLVSLLNLHDVPAGNQQAYVDLAGAWWAAWQSWRNHAEVLAIQPVQFHQRDDEIRMKALGRGRPIADGGYLWQGELRIWDNDILIGWYAANDSSVRSKGAVYFVLHPQGQRMTGRWVGLSYDGDTITGLGAMTRAKDQAESVISQLVRAERDGRDL